MRLETGKRRKVSVSVCNWVWACLGVCARASVSLVCLQVRACVWVCVCVSVCDSARVYVFVLYPAVYHKSKNIKTKNIL